MRNRNTDTRPRDRMHVADFDAFHGMRHRESYRLEAWFVHPTVVQQVTERVETMHQLRCEFLFNVVY